MSKKEFLKKLSRKLKRLKASERDRYVNYYDELISDLVEGGVSEEEAVAGQDSVSDIAYGIMKDADREQLAKKDVVGILLTVFTVILVLVSVICMYVLPDAGAISLIKNDGPSSVFVAGKINEPVVLYIVTVIFVLSDIIYFSIKHRTSYIIIFTVILALFGGAYFMRGTILDIVNDDGDVYSDKDSIEARTEKVIELLNSEDYDTLCDDYSSDELKAYLNKEMMDEVKLYVSDDWGSFVSNGNIYSSEINQNGELLTIVQVNSMYENVSVTYTITFDKDGKLAGLWMK